MFDFFRRGSMLTGSEILKQQKKGNINISPFDEERINPNSYNLSLSNELCVYARGGTRDNIVPIGPSIAPKREESEHESIVINNIEYPKVTIAREDILDINLSAIPTLDSASIVNLKPIDSKMDNEVIRFLIPETGLLLYPGVLYIGRTNESVHTNKFIPMINGRSSGGRLGLSVHICAGFGDIGFCGTFTLEISVVEPLIIYPNMEIAQVCFHTPYGKTDRLYKGKYQLQEEATPSRMHEDRFFSKKEESPVTFSPWEDLGDKPKIPPMEEKEE